MQEFLKSERTRTTQKQNRKVELGEYCERYLEKHKVFDWFIERYYGPAKVLDLWNLAEQNEEEHLRNDLNSIWFELPDHIFNIINNPRGWETFLSFVDE